MAVRFLSYSAQPRALCARPRRGAQHPAFAGRSAASASPACAWPRRPESPADTRLSNADCSSCTAFRRSPAVLQRDEIILLSVHPGKAGLRGGALERKRMLFVLRRGAGLLRPLQRGGRRTFRFPVPRQPVFFLRRKALSRLCAALLQLCDAGFLAQKSARRSLSACFARSSSSAVHALEVRAAVFEVQRAALGNAGSPARPRGSPPRAATCAALQSRG